MDVYAGYMYLARYLMNCKINYGSMFLIIHSFA